MDINQPNKCMNVFWNVVHMESFFSLHHHHHQTFNKPLFFHLLPYTSPFCRPPKCGDSPYNTMINCTIPCSELGNVFFSPHIFKNFPFNSLLFALFCFSKEKPNRNDEKKANSICWTVALRGNYRFSHREKKNSFIHSSYVTWVVAGLRA